MCWCVLYSGIYGIFILDSRAETSGLYTIRPLLASHLSQATLIGIHPSSLLQEVSYHKILFSLT